MISWMGKHDICQDTAKRLVKKIARKGRKGNEWSLIMVPFGRVKDSFTAISFLLFVVVYLSGMRQLTDVARKNLRVELRAHTPSFAQTLQDIDLS